MLLRNDLLPLSSSCGLLEIPLEGAIDGYLRWQSELGRGDLQSTRASGTLDEVVRVLLPLTTPIPTRHLFIRTRSPWTVYLNNARLGPDVGSLPVLARRCAARAMRVTAILNTMPSKVTRDTRGDWGAAIWQVFGTDGSTTRSIAAANDGGRWTFEQSGAPCPFEDTAAYARRVKRERFTVEMLREYLSHFGAHPFEEDWFICDADHPAVLISDTRPHVDQYREYTLDEARSYQ